MKRILAVGEPPLTPSLQKQLANVKFPTPEEFEVLLCEGERLATESEQRFRAVRRANREDRNLILKEGNVN
jgi:hypothetical protein